MTLGVITFALVGLMGILPLALQHSRTAVDETRSAQLARAVFSTLQTEPFTAAPCFAPKESELKPLNLSKLETKADSAGGAANAEASSDELPVNLYAWYSSVVQEKKTSEANFLNEAQIVRTSERPKEAEYRIELRFKRTTASTTATPAPANPTVRGTSVNVRIFLAANAKAKAFEGSAFVPNLTRSKLVPYATPTPAPKP